MMLNVVSVLLSSIVINSKFLNVCFKMLSIALPTYCSTLYTGIITDINGSFFMNTGVIRNELQHYRNSLYSSLHTQHAIIASSYERILCRFRATSSITQERISFGNNEGFEEALPKEKLHCRHLHGDTWVKLDNSRIFSDQCYAAITYQQLYRT